MLKAPFSVLNIPGSFRYVSLNFLMLPDKPHEVGEVEKQFVILHGL